MIIVFDLDYTLLDTSAFKKALEEAVTSLGVSPERYEETYRSTVKREGKVYDYDPDAHLEALRGDFSDPAMREEARRRIDGVLERTGEFLFPGVAEMLERYKKEGATLVLLTLGNERWQKAKVERSGIAELFDRVVATGSEKREALRDILEGETRVLFVNDNGKEVESMMREVERLQRETSAERPVASEVSFVLKRGPKEIPDHLDVPTGESIDDVQDLIDTERGRHLRGRGAEAQRPSLR